MFADFFDDGISEEIIEVTGGALVEYRGAELRMHFEAPSIDIMEQFSTRVSGVARILIGPRGLWPSEPERGTLITVNGEDWVLADYLFGSDGEVIFIALTKAPRN